MLSLDMNVQLPAWVSFTQVEDGAILLQTRTNMYFALDEVGARMWDLLGAGHSLRECHRMLLEEYEVETGKLEEDLLALLEQLREHELVGIAEA